LAWFGDERQQRDMPGPLDGDGYKPLVPGTQATLAAGLDFPALGDEPA
jgi:hypothetical protein